MVACFLCAGIILPDLDAVLFHGAPNHEESKPHVEATESGSCHAENCVLGAVLPQGQKSNTSAGDLSKLLEPTLLLLPRFAAISDRTPSGSSDSRAPPVLTVS